VDVVAVGFYLSTAFFLLPLALIELGLIFKKITEEKKIEVRFSFLSAAIVVFCLIGMIFRSVKINQTPGNDKMNMDMQK